MKEIKIVGLGLGVWFGSLIWPGINTLLTEKVMVALGLGLGALLALYLWGQHDVAHHGRNGTGQNPQPPLSGDTIETFPVLGHSP
jgi:hypothetical protein